MALDRNKLQNVNVQPDGSFTARCPACAGSGSDNAGNHLKVFQDGRFACVVHPGEAGKAHRAEITRMAGDGKPAGKRQVKAISIRTVNIPPPTTLMTLGRLGRHVTDPNRNRKVDEIAASPTPIAFRKDPQMTRPSRPPEESRPKCPFLQSEDDPASLEFMPKMTGEVLETMEDVMRFLEDGQPKATSETADEIAPDK